MPLTIPPFVQYQSPIVPLRGLWNNRPPEGDYFVNVECDWLVSPPGNAVQFQFAGNSPVALSQIAALCVDNSRCGSDVAFIFPDSGWQLVVPANDQVIAPVFTNALMFYASAPSSRAGDVTIFQVLNSIPPPIPIQGALSQNSQTAVGIPLTNGNTQIIPTSVSGTLNGFQLTIAYNEAAASALNIILFDSVGELWGGSFILPAGEGTLPISQTGLNLRFRGGVYVAINSSTATGSLVVNLYYVTP